MNGTEEKRLKIFELIRKPRVTNFEQPEGSSGDSWRSKYREGYRYNDRDLG